jgi:hypothetical protein
MALPRSRLPDLRAQRHSKQGLRPGGLRIAFGEEKTLSSEPYFRAEIAYINRNFTSTT